MSGQSGSGSGSGSSSDESKDKKTQRMKKQKRFKDLNVLDKRLKMKAARAAKANERMPKLEDIPPDVAHVVDSAVRYLDNLINFYEPNGDPRVAYQCIEALFANRSSQDAFMSGRLFTKQDLNIRKPDGMVSAVISIYEKNPHGENRYNFESAQVIENAINLIQRFNAEQAEHLIDSVLASIEFDPQWKALWQRPGMAEIGSRVVGVKAKMNDTIEYKTMKNRILDALVYATVSRSLEAASTHLNIPPTSPNFNAIRNNKNRINQMATEPAPFSKGPTAEASAPTAYSEDPTAPASSSGHRPHPLERGVTLQILEEAIEKVARDRHDTRAHRTELPPVSSAPIDLIDQPSPAKNKSSKTKSTSPLPPSSSSSSSSPASSSTRRIVAPGILSQVKLFEGEANRQASQLEREKSIRERKKTHQTDENEPPKRGRPKT